MKNANIIKLLAVLTVALCLVLTSATPTIANQTGTITEESTNTGIRMQPIYDRLKTITKDDIQSIIKSYKDLSTHWCKTHAATLISLEIMSGTGKGKFEPNGLLTTEQFITMLVRSMGYKPESIPGASWSAPYIKVALDEGIIKDGEFKKYDMAISREQMARLLINTAMKVDKDPTNEDLFAYYTRKIKDYISIGDRYKQAVLSAYTMGLIGGNPDGTFKPKSTLTRAEACVVVVKLIDSKNRLKTPLPQDVSFEFTNPKLNESLWGGSKYCVKSEKTYHLNMKDFPMEEIFYVSKAMVDNENKITGGVPIITYEEKQKGMDLYWLETSDLAYQFTTTDYNGVITPRHMIAVCTDKIYKKTSEEENLGDNDHGNLYHISSYDAASYDKYVENYVYEVMKVWFGSDYSKAKQLHDKYLKMTINCDDYDFTIAYLNGRQVIFAGGKASAGGPVFSMDIWAKDYISKNNVLKY